MHLRRVDSKQLSAIVVGKQVRSSRSVAQGTRRNRVFPVPAHRESNSCKREKSGEDRLRVWTSHYHRTSLLKPHSQALSRSGGVKPGILSHVTYIK